MGTLRRESPQDPPTLGSGDGDAPFLLATRSEAEESRALFTAVLGHLFFGALLFGAGTYLLSGLPFLSGRVGGSMPVVAVLAVLGLLVVGVLFWAIGLYNRLVSVRTQVDQAWANIDVLLKQRHDELSKLIEVVKGAKDFEQSTLEKVIAARNRYATAAPEQSLEAGSAEGLALKQLFALAEAYPDLKSNQNFLKLQESVAALEEQIADRRELYNAVVNTNNTRLDQFPDMLLASAAGLHPRFYFQVDEGDRQDVAVQF
jgi:LemA protein